MDKTPVAHEMTKTALYDGRVRLPQHPKLLRELQTLEKDARTGKIDHTSHGSKDISDALAGVIHGLTMRREVWVAHSIPLWTYQNPSRRHCGLKTDKNPSNESVDQAVIEL